MDAHQPARDGTAPPAAASMKLDAPEPASLTVRLCGDWSNAPHLPASGPLEEQLEQRGGLRRIGFDTRELGRWDTALVAFAVRVVRIAEARRIPVDRQGLPEGAQRLLRLALAVPEREGAGRRRTSKPLLQRVGDATLELLADAREGLAFLGAATLALGRFLTGRARYRRSDLLVTLQEVGAQALPIVSLISVLVGLILAFVGAMQLQLFGAEIFVADLVGIGMAREMGAMMAAIIMAGRTGAAFAAQLGTMTVNEEIDALRTLGISPMDFLVLPRMVALIVMMPLLTVYAIALGILGGAAVGITLYGINPAQYWIETQAALDLTHFGIGLFKAAVFGVLIALAGCLRGIQCGRSAMAVGQATTSAVVTAIVLIIVSDSAITVITSILDI